MPAPLLLCCAVDPRDPCSRRVLADVHPSASTFVDRGIVGRISNPSRRSATASYATNRRRFLATVGGALILPALLPDRVVRAAKFVSDGVDPAKLWDGDRQLVFAYKRGEELGEVCQRLEAVKEDLPVSILWRLPPDWVKVFPTIHFEVSSRRWKMFEGWEDDRAFVEYYQRFNPPPKSADEDSPFKQYAAGYVGPEWTYPGEIDEHLLDPNSMHRFSKFELQGMSKQEKENLHAAHHESRIDPGVRPPRKASALAAS